MDHNELWKILQEMGIPEPFTCLLRNLYAGQEATITTRHETTDWFQIGKGVRQGCILSPCSFNWHAEWKVKGKMAQWCLTLCDPMDCPWTSLGQNTGVGCHFLLQCRKAKGESEVIQSCPTSQPHGLQLTRLLHPWDLPGKSTGVGCHCLLRKLKISCT